MIELEKVLTTRKEKVNTPISLFGKLEAIVGNYFLSEVTNGIYGGLWNSLYFDGTIDSDYESVERISQNLIGYVDQELRWAFVIEEYMEKFKLDTAEYELTYIPVSSLTEETLCCHCAECLPEEVSSVLWIDDDFMNDENVPFDMDTFIIIDEGTKYLNPKHFSVNALIEITQQV